MFKFIKNLFCKKYNKSSFLIETYKEEIDYWLLNNKKIKDNFDILQKKYTALQDKILNACDILGRGTGKTTWLLNSALINSGVILVFASNQEAKRAEDIYKKLYLDYVKKIGCEYDKDDYPVFVSIQNINRLRGLKKPIIFDPNILDYFLD